jgi:HK97 family phage major capsid protein
MTRLDKYKNQHGETVASQKAILEAAEATGGSLTADQDKEYKVLNTKRVELEASIDRETAIEAAERKATAVVTQAAEPTIPVVTGGRDREIDKPWLSRATGSRYGGVQGYWINEADQITKSKPKFRQVRVEPQELAVLVYLTDKLLQNSSAAALDRYVTTAAGDEINFLVGDSLVNGTGAGQPLGVMNAPCLITVNKETSQAAATFQQENVSKMWARMHPRWRQSAVWLMNVDCEPQLDTLNTS